VKYFTPLRIAATLLVLFCAGHTIGGMLSQRSLGLASDVVFASMKAVHFTFNGSTCTWYGFWLGFGLMVSVFLLFSAFLAWRLDGVRPESWPVVSPIAWALAASYACTAALSWAYFFAGPGVIATAVTLLLVMGAIRKQRSGRGGRQQRLDL
jgi:hypothetical protein